MLTSRVSCLVLAPNDEAFDKFLSSTTAANNFTSQEAIGALLSYHILKGVHSYAEFTNETQFITTLLSDATYSNVTGGQVVELTRSKGNAVVNFSVNTVSKLVGPTYDLIFLGGFIHIIDEVLVCGPFRIDYQFGKTSNS